uniref:Uncharacterized protein n=1 Tax=Daphnia galeata TaxID=27404 RepID=A0A8J2RHF5_9CRUS|nr:unnamed protein product [Daphnia galeata]
MSRLIINHVQRLTSTVKNQCLGTGKNTAQSHFSKISRHFSSVIDDDQLEDKGFTKHKKKSSKMITFKDKIEQHDLDSKLNNVRKWLSKGYFVKGSITNVSRDAKKVEQMYNDLMKELAKEGKFQIFKTSSRETKFSIEPSATIKSDEKKET